MQSGLNAPATSCALMAWFLTTITLNGCNPDEVGASRVASARASVARMPAGCAPGPLGAHRAPRWHLASQRRSRRGPGGPVAQSRGRHASRRRARTAGRAAAWRWQPRRSPERRRWRGIHLALPASLLALVVGCAMLRAVSRTFTPHRLRADRAESRTSLP